MLDDIDKRLLSILQGNGRLTYSALAEQIGLTTSPCIERVKRLEREGYIQGYSTLLKADKMGLGLVVFVQIQLDRTSTENFSEFRESVKRLESVQECYLVAGSFDFLIKVRLNDMEAYRRFLEDQLLTISGVRASTTIAVMETIKESLALPL